MGRVVLEIEWKFASCIRAVLVDARIVNGRRVYAGKAALHNNGRYVEKHKQTLSLPGK